MSLNKFLSKKVTFTNSTLTSKPGYEIDYNSPKFNVSIANGMYTLQGTLVTSSTVASSDVYFDFTLPGFDNLFDPDEIKGGIDESRYFNHSQGAETLASGVIWGAWGIAIQSPGVVRCFLRGDKNNTASQANFFTISLSINTLI